jgi:hypothetical protein
MPIKSNDKDKVKSPITFIHKDEIAALIEGLPKLIKSSSSWEFHNPKSIFKGTYKTGEGENEKTVLEKVLVIDTTKISFLFIENYKEELYIFGNFGNIEGNKKLIKKLGKMDDIDKDLIEKLIKFIYDIRKNHIA